MDVIFLIAYKLHETSLLLIISLIYTRVNSKYCIWSTMDAENVEGFFYGVFFSSIFSESLNVSSCAI